MDINKLCVGIIILLTFGVICGITANNNAVYGVDQWWQNNNAEAWIQANDSSVYFSGLTATIHVRIKNNADHIQYFKISNVYTGSLVEGSTIQWIIDWTSPPAVKMVDAVSPELGGDMGWKINPGETKDIAFKLHAVGPMGDIPSYIFNAGAVPNTYWPLIPDPGMMNSFFIPNEIEYLNPNLDLQHWKGTFSFLLTNVKTCRVHGIVRAPIVPTDSKLTYSNPRITFIEKKLLMDIASWDVNLGAGASAWFTYTYEWPSGSSSSTTGTFSSPSTSVPKTSATTKTSSVPTPETGVPYGLFVIGGVLAAGGLIYARFMR
ncbi:MAG: hypothetical protein HZC47_04975 [Methanobacterium sp.]|uniref:hypothetical protein n=1 Tax=Methanobacterium sp. TaxID=2164 RepID=UPI003D6469B0|nr:hypothetical protein [Methanobacterium sp.]